MTLYSIQKRFYFALALIALMTIGVLHASINNAAQSNFAEALPSADYGVRLSVLHMPGEIFPSSKRNCRACR